MGPRRPRGPYGGVARKKRILDYNKRVAKMAKKDAETPPAPLLTMLKQTGWSYVDLSKATGIHKANISHIFSSRHIPSLMNTVKLARALGMKLEPFALALLRMYAERHGLLPSTMGVESPVTKDGIEQGEALR